MNQTKVGKVKATSPGTPLNTDYVLMTPHCQGFPCRVYAGQAYKSSPPSQFWQSGPGSQSWEKHVITSIYLEVCAAGPQAPSIINPLRDAQRAPPLLFYSPLAPSRSSVAPRPPPSSLPSLRCSWSWWLVRLLFSGLPPPSPCARRS